MYHISGMYFLQPIATDTSKFSLFLEFYHCGGSLVYLGVLERARVNFIKENFLTEIVYTPWYPMVSRIIQIFDFSNLGGYASAGYCFTEKHHFSYQEGRP